MSDLSITLLEWYDRNKRDLPWRKSEDPYRVWVSEIMLQQTRVEAVVAKYLAFIAAFPTVESLAQAEENAVMTLWQGLGYYRRAHNLWNAAKILCQEYQGEFPTDYAMFLGLPGVGEYTANAVFSIVYQEPRVAMDGNLLRVAARLKVEHGSISQMPVKKGLGRYLALRLAVNRPGDFNQALMDLASSVCVPKKPRCLKCPIRSYCLGYALGVAHTLPVKKGITNVSIVPVSIFWCENQAKQILLRRRKKGGFLQGLWELPWEEQNPTATVAEAVANYGRTEPEVFHHTYTFSHKQWLMSIRRQMVDESIRLDFRNGEDVEYSWVAFEQLADYPMSTVFREVINLKVLVS